ncbi:hypothetical protein ACKKBG_A14630 [Auxenochlorella protothecoides x Auxenochlorella symbiontica]
MDFSEGTPYTGSVPQFSPDGQYIAHAQACRLVVREASSLAVVALFSVPEQVEALAWSPDSVHILAGPLRTGSVLVFSVEDSAWSCCIEEGSAGCVRACWSPSGAHVLLVADFCIRLSVWSLVGQTCLQLQGPKHAHAGLAFSPDGLQLAVAQRSACKDSVAVYDTRTWQLEGRWSPGTQDLADMAWNPDGSCLAVWEAPTVGHGLLVLSPGGEVLARSASPGAGLGIRTVAWSPSGQLLAIGSYDGEVQLLSSYTWQQLASFPHPGAVQGPVGLVAYSEVEEERTVLGPRNGVAGVSGPASRIPRSSPSKDGEGGWREEEPMTSACCPQSTGAEPDDQGQTRSRFLVSALPMSLQPQRPAADRPPLRMGIGTMLWSHDGTYLATRCDSTPNTVRVWDSGKLALASLVCLKKPVRSVAWDLDSNRLMMCSGYGKLYLWTADGASCVHIPLPGMKAGTLSWHPTQPSLLLASRDSFACAFL